MGVKTRTTSLIESTHSVVRIQKMKFTTLVTLFSRANNICGALRDLVPFVQFKKREKHPWRSVKINTPPWV